MKRIMIAILSLICLVFAANAQNTTLAAKDARSMGLGGTFSAFSSGYSSFFGNPAGFAGKGSLTVIDDASWVYLKPTLSNLSKVQKIILGEASEAESRSILNDFITSNGFGGGSSAGFGWTGGGFALGAFLISDQYIFGNTVLGSKVISRNSANAVLGMALSPINGKNFKLSFGGDVRPFFRIDSAGTGWGFYDILDPLIAGTDIMTVLRSRNITSGYGLAMDFGGMLTVGPLLFGVAVRDVAPTFNTGDSTIGDLIDGKLPSFVNKSMLSPQVAAGIGLSLKIVPKIIETNIYAEMKDVISVVQGGSDPFARLHAGADLKLLNFVTLRGGINSGYYSVGAGIDLIVLELDAAVFTEELGIKAGDNPRSGVALQAAFRF